MYVIRVKMYSPKMHLEIFTPVTMSMLENSLVDVLA